MREILFRGKTEEGEWVQGYPIRIYEYGGKVWEIVPFDTMNDINHFVIPETVGQFTGLTDKNGKKIFEGDILAETWWGELYAKNPILCKFHNGSFCFTKYRIWDTANDCKRAWVWKQRFLKKTLKYCEVIGNIHDNKELLGE